MPNAPTTGQSVPDPPASEMKSAQSGGTSSDHRLQPSGLDPEQGMTPRFDRPDQAAVVPTAPKLSLTDFVDLGTLQEIQDAFTSVTRLNTSILDATDKPVTLPTDTVQREQSDQIFEQLIDLDEDPDSDGRFIAPITVEGQTLGSIVIEPTELPEKVEDRTARVNALAQALKLDEEQARQLNQAADEAFGTNRGAAIQFLYLMANAIARLCFEQYHAQQRLEELSVLYRISTLLAGHRDIHQVLDNATHGIADLLKVKAVVVRLLRDTPDGPELQRQSSTGLSEDYIQKRRLLVNRSELLTKALRGEVVFIEDMASDPRVFFPEQARDEGLGSMLCVGIIYQGQPIGTLQLFTDEIRHFTQFEVDLLKAITPLLATAIEKTRLDAARQENQQMLRQLRLAADVQRRMLPRHMPVIEGFEIAARYVPSVQLSGDFYDFIDLEHSVGIGIGDVVGKGIAASLLMAGVRASLRAFAQDVYDLDEVIARVNATLCRDTLESEFATLWYGTLDPEQRRLTYCNAGHEPPMLLRDGKIMPLEQGGMIVGVDRTQTYEKGILDLETDDLVLFYTDGVPDAMDPQGNRLGRERVEALLQQSAGGSAEDVLNHILWAVRRHTGPRRATDDTTLVVLKAV